MILGYNQFLCREFLTVYFQKSRIRINLQEKWKNLASLPTNLKLDAILNQKVTSVDRFSADDRFDMFTRTSSCIRKKRQLWYEVDG